LPRPIGSLIASFLLSLVLLGATAATSSLAQQRPAVIPSPLAQLTRLAEDTYAWQYGGYTTMFIVTSEGVILADPIGQPDPREPELLKAVIKSVTDQPVVYLVNTHGNSDHAFGGDTFADTATLVGTPRAAEKLAALNSPRHPVPTMLVTDHQQIQLGGAIVHLYNAGVGYADDHLIVYYPARGIMHAADFIPVREMAFRDLQSVVNVDAWVNQIAWVEGFDFDVFIPGHGELGDKTSVTAFRNFVLDLGSAIRSARARGLGDNTDEMVAAARAELAPRYGTWENFESSLPLNIAGIIRVWASQ